MKGKKAKALLAMLLAVQMAASGATAAFAQGATLDVAPQPSQVLVEEQEGVVYLSDLQWTDMTTAWGEPQKDQGLDETPSNSGMATAAISSTKRASASMRRPA